MRCGLHLCGSGWGPVAGFCENGNEHSGSIKAGNVLPTWVTISFTIKPLIHGFTAVFSIELVMWWDRRFYVKKNKHQHNHGGMKNALPKYMQSIGLYLPLCCTNYAYQTNTKKKTVLRLHSWNPRVSELKKNAHFWGVVTVICYLLQHTSTTFELSLV